MPCTGNQHKIRLAASCDVKINVTSTVPTVAVGAAASRLVDELSVVFTRGGRAQPQLLGRVPVVERRRPCVSGGVYASSFSP